MMMAIAKNDTTAAKPFRVLHRKIRRFQRSSEDTFFTHKQLSVTLIFKYLPPINVVFVFDY
jgi:hypothetical protein